MEPALTVYRLFQTRADLCRTVYTHAKVKVGLPYFVEHFIGYLHMGVYCLTTFILCFPAQRFWSNEEVV